MASDRHMEAGRELFRDYLKRIEYDRRACFEHDELLQELVSEALAQAEREGFAAGFAASSDGYNGRFGFEGVDFTTDKDWCAMRDAILSQAGEDT